PQRIRRGRSVCCWSGEVSMIDPASRISSTPESRSTRACSRACARVVPPPPSAMPRWQWRSARPGTTYPPSSRISAPRGSSGRSWRTTPPTTQASASSSPGPSRIGPRRWRIGAAASVIMPASLSIRRRTSCRDRAFVRDRQPRTSAPRRIATPLRTSAPRRVASRRRPRVPCVVATGEYIGRVVVVLRVHPAYGPPPAAEGCALVMVMRDAVRVGHVVAAVVLDGDSLLWVREIDVVDDPRGGVDDLVVERRRRPAAVPQHEVHMGLLWRPHPLPGLRHGCAETSCPTAACVLRPLPHLGERDPLRSPVTVRDQRVDGDDELLVSESAGDLLQGDERLDHRHPVQS